MKDTIRKLIENEYIPKAEQQILEYEQLCPRDPDIYTYRCLCELYKGNHKLAYQYGEEAVRAMPYSADAHYNFGFVCTCVEEWTKAYEHYAVALELKEYGMKAGFDNEMVEQEKTQLIEFVQKIAEKDSDLALKKLSYLETKERYWWGVQSDIFRKPDFPFQWEYCDYEQLPPLQLVLGSESSHYILKCGVDTDFLPCALECQRVSKGMREVMLEIQQESFISLVSGVQQNLRLEKQDDAQKEKMLLSIEPGYYVNYRFPKGKFVISGEEPFRIGSMIPIEHRQERKRLVLNIFLDGLSWYAIRSDFQKYMPNTAKFFEKGMICTNVHTTADWTFPSVASIVTGQTAANHKMLHSRISRYLDEKTPILFEYFKGAGYNTSKIGGNWRVTPNSGYARGMDRVIYRNMYHGHSAGEVVSEVIEQMYRMQETDQFIWMEIGELHKVADEISTGMLVGKFPIQEIQEFKGKLNSVKQEYDETKIKLYLEQVKKVDRKLAALYQYIEENYGEEEIVVSMFADHGQGYLIPPGEEFLSEGRSNVAFMIRDNRLTGRTDEVISIADYSGILCKLAGIPYNYEMTDAQLPKVFGGNKERKFAITESIHVGDPYEISLKGKDFMFYLKGQENVTQECRVPLKQYRVKLIDADGNRVEDKERISYYTNFCLEHIAPCVIYDGEEVWGI